MVAVFDISQIVSENIGSVIGLTASVVGLAAAIIAFMTINKWQGEHKGKESLYIIEACNEYVFRIGRLRSSEKNDIELSLSKQEVQKASMNFNQLETNLQNFLVDLEVIHRRVKEFHDSDVESAMI
jgi:dipeptide/tripeptide permease